MKWWYFVIALGATSFFILDFLQSQTKPFTVVSASGGAIITLGDGLFGVCGDIPTVEQKAIASAQSGYFWEPEIYQLRALTSSQQIGQTILSELFPGAISIANAERQILCVEEIPEGAESGSFNVNQQLLFDGWIITHGTFPNQYPAPKWILFTPHYAIRNGLITIANNAEIPVYEHHETGGWRLIPLKNSWRGLRR